MRKVEYYCDICDTSIDMNKKKVSTVKVDWASSPRLHMLQFEICPACRKEIEDKYGVDRGFFRGMLKLFHKKSQGGM